MRTDVIVEVAGITNGMGWEMDERSSERGAAAGGVDVNGAPLWQSEERFRLLVESVKDYAIFMLDPRGIVTTWNAGAERIKGYAAEDIIGQHFAVFYPQESVARGWPEEALRLARSAGSFEDEGWRIRKDGSRFWANVVITALFDPDGSLYGFAKVTRDLSDRKRIEILEQSERRMKEFLAMLSHELRNPLAPIRNAVSVMRRHRLENPDLIQSRDVIDRQVAHLAHLVDDLLDVSRVTTGHIKLVKEPVEMADVLARAVEASMPLIEENRHRLEVARPDQPVRVEGDPTRLAQVVTNLLHNAAKYTPPGGEIFLSADVEDGRAVVRVRDTGVGIPPELMPTVFELFTQGDRSLDRGEGGLGIGLTLVRLLVEKHEGQIDVSSDAGQGSEFVVSLPLIGDSERPEELSASADDEPAPVRASRSEALRVLLVEDNPDVAESMEMILELWGHDVRIVSDGPSALDLAPTYRPDVILLDIGLPGMDGYEVAGRLRACPEIHGTTLVALTGYGQAADRRRALDAGFDHHMVKPVDPDVLEAFLSSIG